jgi:hypothetical protein
MELKDISMLAITLLVTAVVIGLMSQVLASFQTNMQDSSVISASNNTLTWAGNNTAMSLVENRVTGVVLYNNGSLVNQGDNYTFNQYGITILNQSPSGKVGFQSEWVTDKLNVTKTYSIGSVAYNSSVYGLNTNNTIASYLPLLGLISIAAVIVGIVFVMFMRKRQ